MPRTTEKEPLLFVDSQYKGCFVQEQSFFKTPEHKSQNIALSNYVHNYDDYEPVNFDELTTQSPIMVKETTVSPDFEDDLAENHYETVNIIVDQTGGQPLSYEQPDSTFLEESTQTELIEDVPEDDFSMITQEDLTLANNLPSFDEVESSFDLMSDTNQLNLVEDADEEANPVMELDEKRQELLALIKDLTNRPSRMKAPIVQVVFKDGSLKSGLIELIDDQSISVDNMMDEPERISLNEVEGIRILHL